MEFQIDKLHPVDASADLYEDERQSFHSGWGNLAYEMKTRAKDKNPMTASDAIERILSCKTENEVILLMNHPDIWDAQKYETLSLETPINWSCGAPGLLINLHEGTLDSDRVINWVRVCMGIVRFVDSFDEDTTYFRDFILSVPDGTNYSPEDLLTDIGLPELIEFYKPQLEEHAQYPEPREDWMEGWLKDWRGLTSLSSTIEMILLGEFNRNAKNVLTSIQHFELNSSNIHSQYSDFLIQ